MASMSAPNIVRVPAGNGVHGGRFAPTTRSDSGLTLVDDAPPEVPAGAVTRRSPMVVAIAGLAQDHIAQADGDLYQEFRAYTAPLTDDQASQHWAQLVGAMSNYERFADLHIGADAAEDALEAADTALIGDRVLSDYESVNDADRPGETDYVGFDFARAARDLTADWDAKVDQAAVGIVRTVNRAQAAAEKNLPRSLAG